MKYRVLNDIWHSTECRLIKAGEEFETDDIKVSHPGLKLGVQVEDIAPKKPAKADKPSPQDGDSLV